MRYGILGVTIRHWCSCDTFRKFLSLISISFFIQRQAQQAEKHIRDDFKKLYQFLRLEEADRLLALRQEEEQKIQMMEKKIEEINNEILTLSKTIRDVEENIWTEDLLFIQVNSSYNVSSLVFYISSQKAKQWFATHLWILLICKIMRTES